MTAGKKWAIGMTAFLLLAVGIEVGYLHHERQAAATGTLAPEYGKTDPDDLVFLKKLRPSTPADLKPLIGTTLWVSAGGQMDYYPYAAHRANYGMTAGTLLGAEPLVSERCLRAGRTQVCYVPNSRGGQTCAARLYHAEVG